MLVVEGFILLHLALLLLTSAMPSQVLAIEYVASYVIILCYLIPLDSVRRKCLTEEILTNFSRLHRQNFPIDILHFNKII